MKKQNVKSLKLVKESISILELKKNDSIKGGSQSGHNPANCNTWQKCNFH